jgi:hypothetical protein
MTQALYAHMNNKRKKNFPWNKIGLTQVNPRKTPVVKELVSLVYTIMIRDFSNNTL